MAHAVVKVEDHCRIFRKRLQKFTETAHTYGAEHVQFKLLLPRIFTFRMAGTENAVPEQSDFFL